VFVFFYHVNKEEVYLLSLPSEQVHVKATEELQTSMDMKQALEAQLDVHREKHQKQMAALRDEIAAKEALMEELKE